MGREGGSRCVLGNRRRRRRRRWLAGVWFDKLIHAAGPSLSHWACTVASSRHKHRERARKSERERGGREGEQAI